MMRATLLSRSFRTLRPVVAAATIQRGPGPKPEPLASSSRAFSSRSYDSKLALQSLGDSKFSDVCLEWAKLRMMRNELVGQFADSVFDMALKPGLQGKVAKTAIRPFMTLFCSDLPLNDVIEMLKQLNRDPGTVIFDFPNEQITDAAERDTTLAGYHAIFTHPEIKMGAVKVSGVIPIQDLTANNFERPIVQSGYQALRKLAQIAKDNGKLYIVDAEDLAIEGLCFEIACRLSDEFDNVMVTLQATRLDSLTRLEAFCADPAKPRKVKLVNGTYSADWSKFPKNFNGSKEETHANFKSILSAAQTFPHLTILPCTHNPDLILWASKELGHDKIGNLFGMHIARALVEKGIEELLYLVVGDFKSALLYLMRRWKEHKGSLEPRRELILFAAMMEMLNQKLSLLFGKSGDL